MIGTESTLQGQTEARSRTDGAEIARSGPSGNGGMSAEYYQETINQLTRIGIALTSEHDIDRLLDLIVTEARALTHADAGSLYIREGDRLRFAVSQNKTLGMGIGPKSADAPTYRNLYIPISSKTLAGYVCETGQVMNLEDVYNIPADAPFQFNRDFDKKSGYRTQSMLMVPMRNHQQKVLGVLQLINSTAADGKVIPFDRTMESLMVCIASQAAVAIDNAQLTTAIKEAHLDTIYRLAIAAEYRDEDTALHLKRMSNYSQIVARHYGLPEDRAEIILYASPMHDVGKLGIPDAILLKPGRLTAIEREIMQTHTSIGAKILSGSQSELLEVSRIIALTHHEKFDGSGYPLGLAGEDIPVEGRIVALADVFDALTSRRCYKPAYELEKVMTMLRGDVGKHFDPAVFEAFDRGYQEILDVYNKYRE